MSAIALCSRCMKPKQLEIRIVGPLALAWCADCWQVAGVHTETQTT